MTLTVFILAGGESLRMRKDKGLMFGGVDRLKGLLDACGLQRVIVLCGSEERATLFEGDVWPDPFPIGGVHHLIEWAYGQVDTACLFLPCDAFLMEEGAIQNLLNQSQEGGVPLDLNGRRQPLFAHIPRDFEMPKGALSVGHLLQDLPPIQTEDFACAFTNFNSAEDLQVHRQKLLALHGEHVLQQSM